MTLEMMSQGLNSGHEYRQIPPKQSPLSHDPYHFLFYKDGYGDGFAFFLAPFDSKLSNASIGGTLGLTDGAHDLNTINSLRSVRTIPWAADVMGGRRSEAWISYDSSTRNLSVAISGFVRDVGIVQTLSYIIDFREYLPEQVRFGFSGSTGDQVAIHLIHSWDFSSTLKAVASNRTGEGVIGNRGRKGNRVALFSRLFGGIFDWNHHETYLNQLGKIWLLWRKNIGLQIIDSSSNHVLASVLDGVKMFKLLIVYGSNNEMDRRLLYAHIQNVAGPLVSMGDFNAIRHPTESSNGYEESFFRQKSRVIWISEGDKNTSYFHKSMKARQARNFISSIKGTDGILCTTVDQIAAEAVMSLCRFPSVVVCTVWSDLVEMLLHYTQGDKVSIWFKWRAVIYHVWRERCCRTHGARVLPASELAKIILKDVRSMTGSTKVMRVTATAESMRKNPPIQIQIRRCSSSSDSRRWVGSELKGVRGFGADGGGWVRIWVGSELGGGLWRWRQRAWVGDGNMGWILENG
ncbi:Galactose-binding lectin [Linum perenne]